MELRILSYTVNTKELFATGIQARIAQKIVDGEAGPPK